MLMASRLYLYLVQLCSSGLKVASLGKLYFENYFATREHDFIFTNFHLLPSFNWSRFTL